MPGGNYGTIGRSPDEESLDSCERRPLTGNSTVGVLDAKTQKKRWRETLLYLIPLSLSVFAMEGGSLSWKNGEVGSSFAGSMWVGFCAALGAMIGRMVRAAIVMNSPFFSLSYEVDEGFVIALSVMFGPAFTYYYIIYVCATESWSLAVSYVVMFLACMLSYFGAPLIFRGLLSLSKGERMSCIQTRDELWRDVCLSVAVGNGYAFLVLNSSEVSSHSLFAALHIDESQETFISMVMYAIVFTVGFLLMQTLQNLSLGHTWADVNN